MSSKDNKVVNIKRVAVTIILLLIGIISIPLLLGLVLYFFIGFGQIGSFLLLGLLPIVLVGLILLYILVFYCLYLIYKKIIKEDK